MGRGLIGVLLAVAGIGGCGGSEEPAATEAERSTPTTAAHRSICSSPSDGYVQACETGYATCSARAASAVGAYYNETGPDLETLAKRYASSFRQPQREGALTGCLSAYMDEYDRQHRP
jgi:hypothetical protein